MAKKKVDLPAVQDDVKEVKTLVGRMQKAVESVDIGDGLAVQTIVDSIKKAKAFVTKKQNALIEPAKAIIAEAKDTYGPFLDAVSEAERTIKSRVMEHTLALKKEEDAKKAKLAQRVEKGTMKPETALRKMEDIPEAEKSVGGIKVKSVTDYRIVDESKIPDEYWVHTINKALLRKAVLQEGKQIPGVEIYEKSVGSF